MHPMIGNLKNFTDSQLEDRVSKLNRIYFITNDENVRHQIILLLDDMKFELQSRYAAQQIKMQQNDDNDLDGLINIS